MKEFLKKLKECKQSQIDTGHYSLIAKSYILGENRIIKILEKPKDKVCSKCGRDLNSSSIGINVIIDKSQEPLTIFETSLLFMMYVYGKIPYDYADYHNCIAGKEFIKNIKQIEKN